MNNQKINIKKKNENNPTTNKPMLFSKKVLPISNTNLVKNKLLNKQKYEKLAFDNSQKIRDNKIKSFIQIEKGRNRKIMIIAGITIGAIFILAATITIPVVLTSKTASTPPVIVAPPLPPVLTPHQKQAKLLMDYLVREYTKINPLLNESNLEMKIRLSNFPAAGGHAIGYDFVNVNIDNFQEKFKNIIFSPGVWILFSTSSTNDKFDASFL